ncbi:hypothetical protein L6164_026098 [Bauhinia variegata]|uniref:Uncharacterized protein n=1 Tax=Bauhinia variegata TaxID=167791 RepID=A0ACB9M479_BAUVA|nr:hypothetical protein L6164_026098 [Bauhinia variegata]
MQFSNLDQFKNVVKDYVVFEGKDVIFAKHDNTRYRVMCAPTCPWTILCSWAHDLKSYQVETFIDTHSCPREMKLGCAITKWISEKLALYIRTNPNVEGEDVMNHNTIGYGLNVSSNKVYKAWGIARDIVVGFEREQYGKILIKIVALLLK